MKQLLTAVLALAVTLSLSSCGNRNTSHDEHAHDHAGHTHEAAKQVYHKIRSGDTLGGLAVKYGTTVNSICRLNGITTKTTLRIGRSLRVR